MAKSSTRRVTIYINGSSIRNEELGMLEDRNGLRKTFRFPK